MVSMTICAEPTKSPADRHGGGQDPKHHERSRGQFQETLRYLQWEEAGMLLAYGCYHRSDIEGTDYPEKAYALGKILK